MNRHQDWLYTATATLVLAGPLHAQITQPHSVAWAKVTRDGGLTTFIPGPSTTEIAQLGTLDSRALFEFTPFGFGLPSDAVLVGATLDVSYLDGVGDSTIAFHSVPSDGTIDFSSDNQTAFESPLNLAARWDVDPGQTSVVLPLDPGPIFATLDAGDQPGFFVLQENDEASTTLNVTSLSPFLELTYLDPAAGHRWQTGSGNWTTGANWTGGVPTATENAFVQPAVAATVQAPNGFTDVGSLTLGGGPGDVTFVTQPSQQFNVAGQTTLYPNATLQLSSRAFATGGLHLHPGATLNWGTDGVLTINDGFLSNPRDENFVVDGAGLPLLAVSGQGKLYQSSPQRLVLGSAQRGTLLVGGGGDVHVRRTILGEQVSGVGDLDIQNNDAVFFSTFVEVGLEGAGTVKVRNGGRFEAGVVAVGSSISNNFNPNTQGRFEVGPGGTATLLGGITASGWALLEVEATASQSAAVLNSGTVSVYGDATSVPVFRVAGANATATLTDRLNLGLGLAPQPEGTGRVVIEDGGTLDTPLLIASPGLGLSTTGNTEVVVRNAGSSLSVANDLFGGYFGGHADFQVLDNGVLNVGGLTLLGAAGPNVSAEVTIDGGTWNQLGNDLYIAGLRDPVTGDAFDGGGATVHVLSGTLNSNAPVVLFANATVNLSGGGWINASSVENERGGVFDFTEGTLETGSFVGNLTQDGGVFEVVSTATVEGQYTLNDGTIAFQILDPQAGEPNETLVITGDAALGGTLDFAVPPEYVSQPYTDAFTLISGNSVAGVFDAVNNLNLLDGFALAVTYLPTEVFVTVALAGDANLSGQIEQGDLDAVLQNWGKTAGVDGVSWATGDLNGSGQVEQGDLDAVLQNWGSTAAPDFSLNPGVVPEPTTVCTLMAMSAVWCQRRRVTC